MSGACTTSRRQVAAPRRVAAVPVARLREGRTTLQRQHREENVKASTDVLDYLRTLGVDRVACMLTLAKANESLFWQSQAGGEVEEGEEDTLTLEQCQATVAFLRELGCSAEAIPSLVTAHPPLLAYSVETRLRPLAAYLKELGIDGPRFVDGLVARPSLLALTASKQKQMVDYLISTGMETEEVQKYVLETL